MALIDGIFLAGLPLALRIHRAAVMSKQISVLKEVLPGERRVVLLPEHVKEFCAAGFEMLVEAGAGAGLGLTDNMYQEAGASIVETEDAWRAETLVLKYKPPTPSEFRYLHPGLTLGALFHAEGDLVLLSALCTGGVTAYSYEFFQTEDGEFPMSAASSEIAGKLAVLYGAYHLQIHLGGRGILLANATGVDPSKVLVIGHGNAGGAAARLAAALGAEVVVLGNTPHRLRRFAASMPSNVRCYLNSPETLEREVLEADLVIGAILISTYDTTPMIDHVLVSRMKPGSIIVDVTAGYGSGYIATSTEVTTLQNPMILRNGILQCKVRTLPAAVPFTSGYAISRLQAPYLLNFARAVSDDAFTDNVSGAGKIIDRGTVVHPVISKHLELMKQYEGRPHELS